MRLIFMGSPDFSVTALKALRQAGHTIVAVYCQPPRSKDRGHQLQKGAVHQAAEEMGITVYTPTSLRDITTQKEFASHQADVAVVVAYGLILPQAVLDIPKHGCLNIHASLLPRWRGAAPIQRAILAGDEQTGITIMQMEAGLDTGPMLTTAIVPITSETTTPLLHDALAKQGGDLIVSALEDLDTYRRQAIVQPEEGVTYAAKLVKTEGELDFAKTSNELDCHVRALNPWPGAWFVHNGAVIKVLQAKPLGGDYGPAGQLGYTANDPLVISCRQGALALQKLQRPGARPLEAADFLRGYPFEGLLDYSAI